MTNELLIIISGVADSSFLIIVASCSLSFLPSPLVGISRQLISPPRVSLICLRDDAERGVICWPLCHKSPQIKFCTFQSSSSCNVSISFVGVFPPGLSRSSKLLRHALARSRPRPFREIVSGSVGPFKDERTQTTTHDLLFSPSLLPPNDTVAYMLSALARSPSDLPPSSPSLTLKWLRLSATRRTDETALNIW